MKTLIIYSHPNIEGHCSLILKNVEKELKERKEKYELLDLYKMKFNPVISEEELNSKKENKEVKLIQEKIKDADKLIFIYPIWWNSYPAILKGFVDRIFSAGFGFRYEKIALGIALPKGLLPGKKAAVFLTSGSPKLIFNILFGARGKKTLRDDTLKFCGIKAKSFHYGGAQKIMKKNAPQKLEKLVKKGINWLY